MPSRDDYKFVLLPWEFPGSNFDPRPDAVVDVRWERVMRRFLLKEHEGWLFFRFENDIKRVFAVAPPQGSAKDLDLAFYLQRAIERNEVGRLFTRQGRIGGYEMLMCFVLRTDESGWMREWSGGEWLFFSSPRDKPIGVYASVLNSHWTPHEFQPRSQPYYWSLEKMHPPDDRRLVDRVQTATERERTALRWAHGSDDELKVVASHLARLFGQEEPYDGFHFYLSYQVPPLASSAPGFSDVTMLPLMWRELLERHFIAGGSRWHPKKAARKRSGSNLECRYSWGWSTHTIRHVIPLSPPTFHERLEAMTFLREWLRGKVSDEEAERLLSISL